MRIWLGTMRLTNHDAYMNIKTALDAGYFGIDTAKIYGNEEVIGSALSLLREQGYDDIKIQTKIWTTDFHELEFEFNLMLDRLGVRKIHTLLLHRPSLDFNDSIKAWKELIRLKEKGLVKHIGVSNFDKDMIQILHAETGVAPRCNQIELSVSNFRADRVHYNQTRGIEVQAWSPFGCYPEKNIENPIVKELAQKYQVFPSQILLSFLTTQELSPIIASSSPERLKANLRFVKLSPTEIQRLLTLNIYENKYEETFPHSGTF